MYIEFLWGVLLMLSSKCPSTDGQSVGKGISKHTWAASDPRKCYSWLKEFMPVREEFGGCADDGQCDCATQGRLALDGYTGAPPEDGTPESGPFGFGLHTVNCSYHPYGDLSLFEMDDIFEDKFGDWGQLDGFMDYNLGVWTNDLTYHVEKLQNGNQPFLLLSWQCVDTGKTFYSLLVSPCGFLVIELISDTLDLDIATPAPSDYPRMIWRDWNDQFVASGSYFTPIKISRAVSRVDLVDNFYIDIFNSSIVYEGEFAGGVKLKVLNAPASSVHLQFWEGVPTGGIFDWKAETLEKYLNKVHDEYMESPICGFDQWVDNHIAIDNGRIFSDWPDLTLDNILPSLDENGYHYHVWGGATGNDSTGYDKLYTAYVADPLGWGVQLDFPYFNPIQNIPFYTTTCKSVDGCSGQGYCDIN